MIEGDIDDRCVHDDDDRREHDRYGNDPPVHTIPAPFRVQPKSWGPQTFQSLRYEQDLCLDQERS
jgi:hypothetical protein